MLCGDSLHVKVRDKVYFESMRQKWQQSATKSMCV